MSNKLDLQALLEAGAHFGHQTHKWNPKMKPYVYGQRNGIYIVDLTKTIPLASKAYDFIKKTSSEGKPVLFVGTKRQASESVRNAAIECGAFHVTHRWLGGMLTNFKTIGLSIDKLRKVEKMKETGRNFESDEEMMEVALIENLQREDLNPIEEAYAYKKMIEELEITQKEVAKRVSKSRSTVANTLRLLNLPPSVQEIVSRETISMGHARALLPLEHKKQKDIAKKIVKEDLSVRKTEELVKKLTEKKDKKTSTKKIKDELSPKWIKAREQLAEKLGLDVNIKDKVSKKVITINCRDYKEMKNILDKIN
jgi:ParB-like chromosome segregation protein Spo0J